MKTFRIGGVHLPESKLTAKYPIERLPLPAEVTLPLSQHIGAPAQPTVKKGDRVMRGQTVAEGSGTVSASVHSPVCGTVVRIDTVKTPQGMPVEAIVIKTDADTPDAMCQPTPCDDVREAARRAGIVGLGGAAFPTPVKLAPPPGTSVDTLIINAAECEPYLTCDHALMLTDPEGIVEGARLIMQSAGAKRCVIAVEANKPDAIALLRDKARSVGNMDVMALQPRYPQGGEKQLIEAVTGRMVPSGKLPSAAGVIVQNVATARAVYRAVTFGEPLIERVVTVTGPSLKRPGNFLAALGTPLTALIEAAGGLPDDTGKIIAGGPMMGRAVSTLDSFTVKGLSGLLVLPESASKRNTEEPCVRCGRCVDACPMGLEPYLLATYARRGMTEEAAGALAANCIECGSCSYVCPSSRPLTDFIRIGRQRVTAMLRSQRKS